MRLFDLKFQPKKYLAFELSSQSRSMLLRKYPPAFSKVICHHITIEFHLDEERLKEVKSMLSDKHTVIVTGLASGDGVECFTVDIDKSNRRFDGKYYHITSSVEPPHKPVESNDLLVKLKGVPTAKFDNPLNITGVYRLLPL